MAEDLDGDDDDELINARLSIPYVIAGLFIMIFCLAAFAGLFQSELIKLVAIPLLFSSVFIMTKREKI